MSLIENLEPLVKRLSQDSLVEKILPAITNLTSDKTWRIRLAVVEFLPKLANYISKEIFAEKLENILMDMLKDPVFTIR